MTENKGHHYMFSIKPNNVKQMMSQIAAYSAVAYMNKSRGTLTL